MLTCDFNADHVLFYTEEAKEQMRKKKEEFLQQQQQQQQQQQPSPMVPTSQHQYHNPFDQHIYAGTMSLFHS